MILERILTLGLFYAIVTTGYLYLMMVLIRPRVWALNDYPKKIKDRVPPQTKEEKKLAILIGLPYFIFTFGFPLYATLALKLKLGGAIPLGVAFLNLLVMFGLATIGDLVILDWWVISVITPKYVIIPGTEKEDYKDFSEHFKAHAKSWLVIIPLLLVTAAIISFV